MTDPAQFIPHPHTVVFPSSTKTVLGTLGSAAFIVVGVLFLVLADGWLIKGIGVISVVFFGFTGWQWAKRLGDKAPALVLGPEGFYDNSSATPLGFVPWTEVVGIAPQKVGSQSLLMVHVRNPEAWTQQGSQLTQRARQFNLQNYGTPLAMSSNMLKDTNFDRLVQLFAPCAPQPGKDHWGPQAPQQQWGQQQWGQQQWGQQQWGQQQWGQQQWGQQDLGQQPWGQQPPPDGG
ncbi:STM3941 family protein [Aestuariimicrobium ganziense]|uniref:STM3941 family protein n=1 Tax=Aestuariimicrobium ganziense TaxID=2773677 RepID=UPI001944ECFD|nr:STM3941 family protein [Aestuariimicrobium ganziense]